MIMSEDLDGAKKLNIVEETIKLKRLDFGNKVFAIDKKTMKVYDWNKYNQTPKVLQLVGTLKRVGNTWELNKI